MSDSSYITYPIEIDSDRLTTLSVQQLASLQPGWEPRESLLEMALIEIFATESAQAAYTASLIPAEIFRFVGKSLFNVPAIEGAPASAQSTWAMRDAAGYTVPAGTIVAFPTSGTSYLYFRVQADVVVAPGQTSTNAGEVTLIASSYGEAYNGLPPQALGLVDSLGFVSSVSSTTTTSGGAEVESNDDYLNRLRHDLQLLSPRPILPNDFAVLARNIAGVKRSIAIDGYNPANGTYNNERMVAVALADANGNGVGADIKNVVAAYLDSLREVNFVVNTIDPTYTTINVTATVKALPGYDPATIQAYAVSALTDYLDPSEWDWSTVVRHNELVTLLSNVPGVDYTDDLQPEQDVILQGVASLVKLGTANISVLSA